MDNAYTNVSIVDQLSDYAQLDDSVMCGTNGACVNLSPDIGTVEITEGATLSIKDNSGNPVQSDQDGYPEYTLSYDPKTKTVTADLGSAALRKDWTYTLTFDIRPTQKAYDDYAKNGKYPDDRTTSSQQTEGEDGTNLYTTKDSDYPNRVLNTSAGKPGFYSNTNAYVEYTANDKSNSAQYAKPVLQINSVTLAGSSFVTVRKVIGGRSWLDGESFTFTLTPLAGAPMPVVNGQEQSTLTIGKPDDAGDTAGSQGTNTGSFGDITFTESGMYTYTLQEVRPDDIADRHGLEYSTDKYLITVNVPKSMTTPTVKVQLVGKDNKPITPQPADADEGIATFMNSITTAPQMVQKDLVGREWDEDDEFAFRVQAVDESLKPLSDGAEVPFQPMNATPVADMPNTWNFTVSKSDTSCGPIEEGSDWTTCRADLLFGAVNGYSAKSVKYLVYEIDGGEPGMTYSQARYTFDVGIDGSTGYLSISNVEPVKQDDGDGSDGSGPSTYEAMASLMFTNRYTKPVSALPLTGGDTTARNIVLAGGGVLLLAGAAWLLAKRRRV